MSCRVDCAIIDRQWWSAALRCCRYCRPFFSVRCCLLLLYLFFVHSLTKAVATSILCSFKCSWHHHPLSNIHRALTIWWCHWCHISSFEPLATLIDCSWQHVLLIIHCSKVSMLNMFVCTRICCYSDTLELLWALLGEPQSLDTMLCSYFRWECVHSIDLNSVEQLQIGYVFEIRICWGLFWLHG